MFKFLRKIRQFLCSHNDAEAVAAVYFPPNEAPHMVLRYRIVNHCTTCNKTWVEATYNEPKIHPQRRFVAERI